jgi:hypothetical protein
MQSAGDEIVLAYRRAAEVKSASVKLARCPVQQAVAVDDTRPGLVWKLYADGKLASFPDFDRLQPAAEGVTLELKTRELAGERKEHFALRFEGFVKVEADGLHRLTLASDDGSRLFLHGELLIDNGGPHPRQELGRKVRLAKGFHPIRIDYFEVTGESTLELFLASGSGPRTPVRGESLFHRAK